MLFSDMRCFACGNPPGKTSLSQGEKSGLTSFNARKGGLLEPGSYEGYFIEICDSCLTEGGRRGCVFRSVTENRPPNIYEYIWNPDGDDKPYRLPLPSFIPQGD
jgi:hypothetical protein